MKTETVLYTDGNDVTVTNSFFRVKKSMYQLKGITHHGFLIIRPERLPALLVILLGVLLIVFGSSTLVPESVNVKMFSLEMSVNVAATGLGFAFFSVGSLILGLMKERYAIRISTAEGEKNVIVSRKKEYVKQILDALNYAFLNLVSSNPEMDQLQLEN